jgi:hypothetical protein
MSNILYKNLKSLTAPGIFYLATILIGSLYAFPSSVHAVTITTPDTNSGQVLHFSFEEGTGSTTADLSNTGNNGILVDNASWASGKIGSSSISLDGTDSYVSIPSSDSLQGFNNMTVCSWVYLNSYNAAQEGSMIAVKPTQFPGDPESDPFVLWGLSVTPDGHVVFAISNGTTGSRVFAVSNSIVTLTAWHHICGELRSHDGSLNIFIDGATDSNIAYVKDLFSNSIGSPVGTSTTPVLIGAYEAAGADQKDVWNGYLDEVRVYNRALSSADIQELFNPTPPSISPIGPVSNGDDDVVTPPPQHHDSSTTVNVSNGSDDVVTPPPEHHDSSTTVSVSNGGDDAPSQSNGNAQNNPVEDQSTQTAAVINTSIVGGGAEGGGNSPVFAATFPTRISPVGPPITLDTGTPPATTTAPSCTIYLSAPLSFGQNNNSDDVAKLQGFLDEVLGTDVPTTGYFGPRTLEAVKQYQLAHKDEILQPLTDKGFLHNGLPTGVIGPLTLRTINNAVCPGLDLPMPTIR